MFTQSTDKTLVIALDLETTIRGGASKGAVTGTDDSVLKIAGEQCGTNRPAADPWDTDNSVVLAGFNYKFPNMPSWARAAKVRTGSLRYLFDHIESRFPEHRLFIIGVNVGFDMSYIQENIIRMLSQEKKDRVTAILKDHVLWDLSIVDYYLSGQLNKYPSMKDMAKRYGIKTVEKGDLDEKYWSKYVDTTEIPSEELEEYLNSDVLLTCAIYDKQLEMIQDEMKRNPNFGRLLYDNMIGRTNTLQMSRDMFSLNASSFNNHLSNTTKGVRAALSKLESAVHIMFKNHGVPQSIQDNVKELCTSNSLMAYTCYGVPLTYSHNELVIVDGKPVKFKTGKKAGTYRRKKVQKNFVGNSSCGHNNTLFRHYMDEGEETGFTTAKGSPKLDSATLGKLLGMSHGFVYYEYEEDVIRAYLDYKDWEKEDSTYGTGMIKNMPNCGPINSYCYPLATDYNHTTTATTRLSSSRINVQNLKGG